MNSQGGNGVGGYGGGVGGHGMLNMAMLQSLEHLMGEGQAGQSMMMSGVHQTGGAAAASALGGGVGGALGGAGGSSGDGRTDMVRPETVARSAGSGAGGAPSRYESQKRRDWNTFQQYLKNHRPPLALARCSGAHVLEFLRYLDQFGKTKVHAPGCPFFGHPQPPAPCACPLRQAWGSLDALIGRLRAAYEEHGGKPESNPFGARAVRLYLREVREMQAKARGIAYEKKKRKRPPPPNTSSSSAPTADHSNYHPPPPPPAASSGSSDHQSLLSGSSSLLIPSFN